MLTIDQILAIKAHPDYFKLCGFDGLNVSPNNQNWQKIIEKAKDDSFQLLIVEAMVYLKTMVDAFPGKIEEIGFRIEKGKEEKNGYLPAVFLIYSSKPKISGNMLGDFLERFPQNNALVSKVSQGLKQFIPAYLCDDFESWFVVHAKNRGLGVMKPSQVVGVYNNAMEDNKELVTNIERLSLSQVIPKTSKKKTSQRL